MIWKGEIEDSHEERVMERRIPADRLVLELDAQESRMGMG